MNRDVKRVLAGRGSRAGAGRRKRPPGCGRLDGLFSLPAERPVSAPDPCLMGSKRMEEQWWKGELAADIHQTLRTKVGSRFVPFPPPRSSLRDFLPCRSPRAPALGGRAARLPRLRLGNSPSAPPKGAGLRRALPCPTRVDRDLFETSLRELLSQTICLQLFSTFNLARILMPLGIKC